MLGHQAVLHVRVCRHKGLDLVFANVPVGAGQRGTQDGGRCTSQLLGGTSTIPPSSRVPAHAPEHKQGSVHRLRQCTRHHQLLLLRLRGGVVAHVWMRHARLNAQSAPTITQPSPAHRSFPPNPPSCARPPGGPPGTAPASPGCRARSCTAARGSCCRLPTPVRAGEQGEGWATAAGGSRGRQHRRRRRRRRPCVGPDDRWRIGHING